MDIKEMHKFLDANTMSAGEVFASQELHDLLEWADSDLSNGGSLHIIVEDGNYDDSHIAYCKTVIDDPMFEHSNEDKIKCRRIIALMEPLSVEYREMIACGSTMTEDLFDILYNQATGAN